ncbi:androgen-induced gene 1 protein-like isoform X2 [Saccostrea echinata]|uniref:androgen-induced gene 1 protein-like isoform X2 n=1 Tax=Saccostrea echinata TaxID=191078 RepID=UPI002A7F74D3|nr:androgen-induced gene 1 protein-like isoform X2 [Saccostrea echinata]
MWKAKCYHSAVFVVLFSSFIYNHFYVRTRPGETLMTYKGYGGKFKYLTFWYFIIQTVYFGLCVANDFCGTNVRPSEKGQRCRLQRWRDNFLATIVFPVGMFVVLTFWGIYAIDRELVYPKELDKVIPSWLNHIMHTTILPFLLIDKFLVYHQYPSRRAGFITLLSLALTYLAWILWVAFYANIWVYPILKVLSPHQKAVFIMALLVFFIFLYLLGEFINKTLWDKERKHVKKVKSS